MYVRVNGMTAKQNQWETKLGNISFLYYEWGNIYFLKVSHDKLKMHIINLKNILMQNKAE